MPSYMSREKYLKDYVLKIDKEFEYDGIPAEWAPSTSGRPLAWGDEDHTLDLIRHDPSEGELDTASIAMTPDQRFLAIATNTVIRVYTTAEKKLCATLIAQEDGVGQLFFMPNASAGPAEAKYTLLSEAGHRLDENTVIAWQLDGEGKSLNRIMPFAVEYLAGKAITAIEGDLLSHHELSHEAVEKLRTDIAAALKKAENDNRLRDQLLWQGEFPAFNPTIARSDGTAWLHLEHNKSTQQGMRPADELPQIVIHHSTSNKDHEIRLRGHQDAIMWAAWSPTDPNTIASAAWDQTYYIWDIGSSNKNHVKHIVGPTRGQNWTGAFSSDGKHILFAGTDNVAVYSASKGELVQKLERPDLASWIRYLGWGGDGIALANNTGIILWEPFSGTGKQTEIFKLAKDENYQIEHFKEISFVKCLSQDKLAVQTSENSFCVWDRKKDWKWRFQRPMGKFLDLWRGDCLFVEDREGEGEKLITLDGDWKVRQWKLT